FSGPCEAVAPVRWLQVPQAYATRNEIRTVVSHHAEKRVIGLDNPLSELPGEDPDDVGVNQAPDLRFAFCEMAVQMGILQRDRGLRGEQLQHRDPSGRENARGQGVLEVENPYQLALVEQRHAENGTSMVLPDVRIGGKRILSRGIVENH